MTSLVYDTGALIAADKNNRAIWALHKTALSHGILPLVPAGVLAESWRGGPAASMSRLLIGCEVAPLTPHRARRSGELLRQATRNHGAVDASVVQLASEQPACVIVTSNRSHIEDLAQDYSDRVQVVDI